MMATTKTIQYSEYDMQTKAEYVKSEENIRNKTLVPLLTKQLKHLLNAIQNHDKVTIDGKLLTATDQTEELLEVLK